MRDAVGRDWGRNSRDGEKKFISRKFRGRISRTQPLDIGDEDKEGAWNCS